MKIELEKYSDYEQTNINNHKVEKRETYYKLIINTGNGIVTQKIRCNAEVDQIVNDLIKLTLEVKKLNYHTLNSKKYEGDNFTKSFDGCGQEC